MSNHQKKTAWRQHIATAFMMLIGAICGIVIGIYLRTLPEHTPSYHKLIAFAGFILCIYVAFFIHIIVHEAGHLLFGLMTGYQFRSFRIASFILLIDQGKFKIKRLRVAGTGGQCLMVPPDMKDGKIPFLLYNLGGVIFNLVFSVISLVLRQLCFNVTYLPTLFLIFSIVGFMTAITNGIPMRMGTVDNDGYNAFAMLKNQEVLEAFWVQLKIVEQNSNGVRLKDMPSEWFELPTDEAMKNSLVATRGVFICNRLMDEEKFEEADALIAHLLEIESGIVGLHRNLLICDRIFYELIGQNRREVVMNLLTKEQRTFMQTMKRFPSVLRTEYALALLFEKDEKKAQKIERVFEKVARTYPYAHESNFELKLSKIAKEIMEKGTDQ